MDYLVLRPDATMSGELEKRIFGHLKEHIVREGRNILHIEEDKARRDATVLAILARARQKEVPPDNKYILVSASGNMKSAAGHFAIDFGAPRAVLPVAAVAYMVSLCPDVSFTTKQLQQLLFDPEFRARLGAVETLVLSVLRASKQYEIFTANRALLAAKVKQLIHQRAKEQGTTPWEVRRNTLEAAKTEPERVAADLIAPVIDELAIEPMFKKQLREKDEMITELTEQVRRLERSRGTTRPL